MISLKRSFFTVLLLPILALLSFFTGCGYQLRADGKPVGVKIESLAIPLMTSTSSNLGFESDFTRLIREEFISHAVIPIVPREKAQLVLIGRIHEIRIDPLTFDLRQLDVKGNQVVYGETNRRRLTIRLDAKLMDRGTGQTIWHDTGLEEDDSYMVGTDPLENRYNERQAVMRIARRLAERIYLKTAERF